MHVRQRARDHGRAAIPPGGGEELARRRDRRRRQHRPGSLTLRGVAVGGGEAAGAPRLGLCLAARARALDELVRRLPHAHQRAVEKGERADEGGEQEGPEGEDEREHAQHRLHVLVVGQVVVDPARVREEGVEGHDEHEERGQHRGDDEGQEEAVVAHADAVPHPGAVVVELLHAVVADAAVLRARRLDDVARRAVVHLLLHLHGHGLDDGARRPPRQDARVRERRREQRRHLRPEEHERQRHEDGVLQERHHERQEGAPGDQHEEHGDAQLVRHGAEHEPPPAHERVAALPLLVVLLRHVQRRQRRAPRPRAAPPALHGRLHRPPHPRRRPPPARLDDPAAQLARRPRRLLHLALALAGAVVAHRRELHHGRAARAHGPAGSLRGVVVKARVLRANRKLRERRLVVRRLCAAHAVLVRRVGRRRVVRVVARNVGGDRRRRLRHVRAARDRGLHIREDDLLRHVQQGRRRRVAPSALAPRGGPPGAHGSQAKP
mmetsp:Transcript_27210/g.85643  ORF Transcript_27210/g.85643 Transcript_27210/m.85643 type:complete len:493 (+) Transcript_27210:968-2446(+)